jgi:hypothetical protein
MGVKTKIGSDGSNANRSKISKKQTSTQFAKASINSDGSNGIGAEVESMDAGETETENKKTKELLLRANAFRDGAIQIFNNLAKEKYDAGQREHGGFLVADTSFQDMEAEVIDLWFYIQAMKSKVYIVCKDQRDILFHNRAKDTDQKQTD